MTAQKGSDVLIKVGNGGSPEVFTAIGGLRTTAFTLGNQRLDATNVSSGSWRQLLPGAGIQSMTLSGTGIFTDAASEETVRGYAFANSIHNYEFDFGGDDKLSGPLQITLYERSGMHDDAEAYRITFESAGVLAVTVT